ncbi:hypothetical protein CVT26_015130 [Gymnopilus dilepis]|uniref:Uncharacterized protein n=1 Tax=Gymnopilus dilepis TaxID=231916 RepID=A0A409WQV1_9AGAR|nr:hypothetical protein CVT26_015130 [Gymnopilus dilepis]
MSTRPGEGFQQEAAEAYRQTNGKQAEGQVPSEDIYFLEKMARIDETQEPVAYIRMAIDNDKKAHSILSSTSNEMKLGFFAPGKTERHWDFGSSSGSRSLS